MADLSLLPRFEPVAPRPGALTRAIHFVPSPLARGLAPLCGEWRASTSWTTAPSAVSCVRCRALVDAILGRVRASRLASAAGGL